MILIFFGNIIAKDHFPIAFDFQFADNLANDSVSLFLTEMIELIGRRIGDPFSLPDFCLISQPLRFAKIVEREIFGYSANESRESIRPAHISVPDFFYRYSKCFLRDVLNNIRAVDALTDDD